MSLSVVAQIFRHASIGKRWRGGLNISLSRLSRGGAKAILLQ